MGNIPSINREFQTIVPDDGRGDNKKRRKHKMSIRGYFFREKRMKTSAITPAPAGNAVDCARSLPDFDLSHHGEAKALSAKSCPAGFTPFINPQQPESTVDIDSHDAPVALTLDFRLTEGQERRGLLANSEFECSQIFDYLYVGGASVATSWETLASNGITRVVNCSSAVVENCFITYPNMKYLSLNMVDGRQDDISWFVCLVIQFVEAGRINGEKILIHCEKGVSRSCSFIIAYRIWLTSCSWKQAFDFVKQRRKVCAPNTAFTCNLIEFTDMTCGATKNKNVLFRCAYHLHHDISTVVLKACRDSYTRKLIEPSLDLLDTKGVFVMRPDPDICPHTVYVWRGASSSADVLDTVSKLVESMKGIYTSANGCDIETILEGFESAEFLALFKSPTSTINKSVLYEDLWTVEHEENIVSLQLLNNEGFTADAKIGALAARPSDRMLPDMERGSSDAMIADPVYQARVMEVSTAATGRGGSPRILGDDEMVVEEDDGQADTMCFAYSNTESITSTRAKVAKANIIPALSLSLNMNSLKLQSDNANNQDNSLGIAAMNTDSARRGEDSDRSSRSNSMYFNGSNPLASSFLNNSGSNNSNNNSNPSNGSRPTPTPAPPSGPHSTSLGNISLSLNLTSSARKLSASVQEVSDAVRQPELSNGNSSSSSSGAISTLRPTRPANHALMLNMGLVSSTANTNSHKLMLPLSQLSGNASDKSLSVELSTNRSQCHSVPHPELASFPMAARSDSAASLSAAKKAATPLPASVPVDVGLAREPITLANLLQTPNVNSTGQLLTLRSANSTNNSRSNLQQTPTNTLSGRRNSNTATPLLDVNCGIDEATDGKPLLFQALSVNPDSKSRAGRDYEWEAMGMYDDEDLHETVMLLLLCPSVPHFVWVGASFANQLGLSSAQELSAFVSNIRFMESKWNAVGVRPEQIRIVTAGYEPDEFWTAFSNGY